MMEVIAGLRADAYTRHPLQGEGAIWPEKNCYADLWIGLLHALKLEPRAMLPFVLGIDFEGDQWTFFKPSHDELRQLYGIEVQELTVWRPLIEHAREHLGAGRLISIETDSHWLPDTAGTDYREKHGKTTIVYNHLDEAGERLGYFHNAGYHELSGEDFRRTLQIDEPRDDPANPTRLPLFAELVKLDRIVHRSDDELRAMSRALLAKHLAWRPATNPVERFAQRLAADLPALQAAGLAHYHLWAFGTVRQLGAAFELAAACLDWLEPTGSLAEPAAAFRSIAERAKTLILKGARAVATGKALDGGLLGEAAAAWGAGMQALEALGARGASGQ